MRPGGALLIALIATTVIANINQAVFANESTRTIRVEPFDELAHLLGFVGSSLPSSIEAGLGHVMQLSTYMRSKTSSSMSTSFHIYRRDKFTRNIQFRAVTPATSTGQTLNFANDFQYNLEIILESGFDISKRTVIMIPGYLSDYEEQWAREAMVALINLHGYDINVVVLSWADSNRCIYSQAVATTPLVARQVTVFLHYLAQLGGTRLDDGQFLERIHLIGHSLGAHICGFVGQDLGGRVGRITGLDPAGPTFDTYPTSQRLDRSDAQLVEVLHTNAGHMSYMKALPGLLMHAISSSASSQFQGENNAWFGIHDNIGHIDYYANNGRTQEGCTGSLHVCDHGRAGEIYVDMLQYETLLKASGGTREAHQLSRLWAFRARDYQAFQGGASFEEFCPELLAVKSHLNTTEVAKNFGHCAVPLLDFMTPVDELVRELRQQFHINFDKDALSEQQPRFYFRTQMTGVESPNFISDHYLLKIYLDSRQSTRWDSNECALSATLYMDKGDTVSLELELGKVEGSPDSLALPFAHPMGPRAHGRMQELTRELGSHERMSTTQSKDKFRNNFVRLFPRTISLGFASLPKSVETQRECALAIKLIEVHPINAFSQNNLGALYGGRPLLPGRQVEFLSSSELSERLSSAASTILSLGDINSLGVSLEAAIVGR